MDYRGKESLSIEELLESYNIRWLNENNLASACQIFWNNSPYAMINDLYPNKFKEWEFKVTPARFWTKQRGLEALRWTIEEKKN